MFKTTDVHCAVKIMVFFPRDGCFAKMYSVPGLRQRRRIFQENYLFPSELSNVFFRRNFLSMFCFLVSSAFILVFLPVDSIVDLLASFSNCYITWTAFHLPFRLQKQIILAVKENARWIQLGEFRDRAEHLRKLLKKGNNQVVRKWERLFHRSA